MVTDKYSSPIPPPGKIVLSHSALRAKKLQNRNACNNKDTAAATAGTMVCVEQAHLAKIPMG